MKILLFANTDWYLYNFRLALAQALRARGDEVVLVSPDGPYAPKLREQDFRWICFPIARRGLNPLTEIKTIFRLIRLYRQETPQLVHHFTIKCVLYGSLASHLVGIRSVVNSVEGLGYVFTEGNGARGWLRGIIKVFYRLVLRGSWVIFHNPDDQEFFLENRLIHPDQMTLIRGSGVDLKRFSPRPFMDGTPLVILPARMLWDKGVKEFVDAAGKLKAEKVPARFALVGNSDDDNPVSVPVSQLQAWKEAGMIEWWGWQEKMEDVFEQASIVCLPTFYREGVPKTLIEAAACGRPIIASDVPGCREIVRPGENGLLVPIRDAGALAKALRGLLESPATRIEMGKRSRDIAEKEFATELVISQTLALYQKCESS